MAKLATNTQAPKRKKNASKKTKKSWRKNTDIEDVEEFLEDQRLEERLGGAFKDRADEELFQIDKKGEDVEDEPVVDEEEKPLTTRQLRKKKFAEKPLRCFDNLEIKLGVKDPKKGRNNRRTPEQRMNPVFKAIEKQRIQNGIVKPKEALAKKHRKAILEKKESTKLDRQTRRRTKFEFDLWDANGSCENAAEEMVAKIEANPWINPTAKRHNLNKTGNMKRNVPNDFYSKTSALPSVELPTGGTSYNPSYQEHQDLLWKASVVELDKEKEQRRVELHTTSLFPDAKDAPTQQSVFEEMCEGLDALAGSNEKEEEESNDENSKEGSDEEEEEGFVKKNAKLKTKQKRRKERKLKAEERKKQQAKFEKQKAQDVFKVKSLKKEIREQEIIDKKKIEKRNLQKKIKKDFQPACLSGTKFEEPEIDLKLTEELTGDLRTIKPEGSLLLDRYKSLQKRNIIETTKKRKQVKNPHKRKKVQKRSYKMAFDETQINSSRKKK